MSCLATPTRKVANVLGEIDESTSMASAPSMNSCVMWCDWSMIATVVDHARCSSRQLVNSGLIGNVIEGQSWLRSSSTGLPTRAMA